MKLSVDGLVIWEVKTGETDRVITVLTPEGVISVYARGSRNPKNKLTSPTSMLSYSNFELYTGKNMYTAVDAMVKERFISLFSDISKYSLAVYFCELIKYLAPVEDDASEYLSLLLNTLHILNTTDKDILLVKAVFELRIMSISGYMPDLSSCCECGLETDSTLFFDMPNGVWYCNDCAKKKGYPVNANRAVLNAMRYITESDPLRIFSFELKKETLKTLGNLTAGFSIIHLDKQLATLDFLSKILD